MDEAVPLRCVIYCRISQDRESDEKGVTRQEEDCRALALAHGWEVVRVFVDNDLSASTRSKKKRRGYDSMIRAVNAGTVDVIVSYSNGRLTRRPLELEDLIKLHEQTNVLIHTVKSGNDDLSTADGRMVARIKAAVDAAGPTTETWRERCGILGSPAWWRTTGRSSARESGRQSSRGPSTRPSLPLLVREANHPGRPEPGRASTCSQGSCTACAALRCRRRSTTVAPARSGVA
ncbi:recombinase family protein [Actinoplanes sp. TBRC 11911]|uniref:recombinase family protein n=1 Tax=Actinoplanes sp. TBRC 11911 TaxID=2729386 RepID=UPI00145EF873|nr:recombinase family protein [Actinoplanes sp. TBRC 11911]